VDGVAKLSTGYSIVQPFEYCIHLEKDEIEPTSLNLEEAKALCNTAEATIPRAERRVWRSFAANYETNKVLWESQDYDVHGHVGFAWGSTRELLTSEGVSGLYDKALCGGADHIMAHACVGQIPHCCITKAYVDTIDLKAITSWSKRFYFATQGKLGFIPGDAYHFWHGDLEKRNYLVRIQDFSKFVPRIIDKDANGLYTTTDEEILDYTNSYFDVREVTADSSKATTVGGSTGGGYYETGGYYEAN